MADGAVIFTHYGTMLNEIRSLYGRTPVSETIVGGIVKGISNELIFDIVADKFLGNVPLEKLITSFAVNNMEQFNQKITKALESFD